MLGRPTRESKTFREALGCRCSVLGEIERRGARIGGVASRNIVLVIVVGRGVRGSVS